MKFNKFFIVIFCLFLTTSGFADQKVCTLYIHGFTGSPQGAEKQKIAFSDAQNYQAPALPDTQKETGSVFNRLIAVTAKFWKKNINPSKAFMGQGPDIEVVAQCQKQTIADHPFVLFGICRGGTAAINYIARHNPSSLKALVIESTPSSMPALLHEKMAQAGIPEKFVEDLFKALFSAYTKHSIPLVENIKNIKNKNLPVLILHSKDDQYIQFEHALILYLAFKEHGFENVYLAPLHGKHAYSLQEDSKNYLTVVHSFYKQYGLEYNAAYATKTMNFYEYDIDHARQKVAKYQKKLEDQLRKTHKKMAFSTGLMGYMFYLWNWRGYR